jgi:bifunctional non-homologous end joining protein LigD
MAKSESPQYSFAAGETPRPYDITLHYAEGGSDKLYRISIEPADALFVVNYANGRRGSTMATGTKTNSPVAWPEARKICNKLLSEKVGKGYNPIAGSALGEQAAEGVAVVSRPADTGVRPQLLNPVGAADLERLLQDDTYIAQPKHDGERRFARVTSGVPEGINRKGQTIGLPAAIGNAVVALAADILVDGEQVGDVLYIFDLLKLDGDDFTGQPLAQRLAALSRLLSESRAPLGGPPPLQRVETAFGEQEKRALLDRIAAAGGEGVVFKRLDALYVPGRPASGGPQLKHKLHDTLSAIVTSVNAQRSVAIALIEPDGRRINVGNVTVPANQPIPAAGDIVEIRYLYAFEGGSLYQPVLQGIRHDIDAAECQASQRKFRPVFA